MLIKILRWQPVGPTPDFKKYILIVAPHTSNWDLLYGAITAFALKLDLYFMAKHQLFRKPFGPLMRWLGAIRIDRRESHDTVKTMINMFDQYDKLVIAIPPEGTRSQVKYWKTGFYHIAKGARLPIAAGFINIAEKTAGIGPVIHPTGDIEKDMITLKDFYAGISDRYKNVENLVDIERCKNREP